MTVQYVLATAFTLVLLVVAVNVLVDLYVRAAVRDALDEGARAAVPIGTDATTCERRARTVVAALARGRVGRGVTVACRVAGEWVVADADLTLPSFVPWLVPGWHVDLRALARRELP